MSQVLNHFNHMTVKYKTQTKLKPAAVSKYIFNDLNFPFLRVGGNDNLM